MPIFDQGYQHWSGELSGSWSRWWTITRNGVRVGLKNRLLRLYLLVALAPALGLAGMLCIWSLLERQSAAIRPLAPMLAALFNPELLMDPKHYRLTVWTLSYSYFLDTELWLSMIMVLLVGPNLISQDLRFNALPLYFSRPLRRIDYFAGKLGIVAAFLAMVTIAPSIVAYVLGMLLSLDVTIVPQTIGLLLSAIAYGAVMAVSTGLLILALSSLSRNSRYVVLFWLGIWFLSGIMSVTLQAVAEQERFFARNRAEEHYERQLAVYQSSDQRSAEQEANLEKMRQELDQMTTAQAEAERNDWRPMVSYTANLARVGRHLLGTDAAWKEVSEFQEDEDRQQFLMRYMGSQYPWEWSAAVLAGLCGVSLCILSLRIRSLDRLK
jgi:ABC-2 type transport system permease protein